MIDDSELLRRFVEQRSEEAFNDLVRRHVDLVFSAALRRVGNDVHLAEDVAQSVFIVLAHKAPSLVGHPVISGWLHRCTQFAAVDAVRQERRRARREEQSAAMIADIENNAADVEWKRIGPMIDAVLDELSERDRDAIVLRYFENRSFAEIGVALRLSEDAARMCLNRALDRLRAVLARHRIASSAAALGAALTGNATLAAPSTLAAAAVSKALTMTTVVTTSTSGALSFLNLMSSTKSIATIAAVAILGIGVAIRQTLALRDAQASVADLSQRLAERPSAPTRVVEDVSSGNRNLNVRVDAAVAPPTTVDGNRAPLGSVLPVGTSIGLPNVDFSDAETRALVIQERALRARRNFDLLFRKLGLSAEKQEQFVNALTESDQQMIDLALSMEGIPPTIASELKEKTIGAAIVGELSTRMQELLGPDGFKEYRKHSSELQVRPVVEQLARQLDSTPDRLNESQATQLLAMLDNTRLGKLRAPASPSNSMNGEQLPAEAIGLAKLLSSQQNIDRPRFITDEAMSRAGLILTAPQLAALKRLQAEQLYQLKLAPALLSRAPVKR